MQEKIRIQDLHHSHGFKSRVHFSCIAEFSVPASRPFEHQRYVDQLLTVLQLFRLGSVSAPRYEIQVDSFSALSTVGFGGLDRIGRLAYEISKEDAPKLKHMLEMLMPMVPTIYSTDGKQTFLSSAVHWYSESLLAIGPPEAPVAFAVAALEALFLGAETTTEVSYRLQQRVISLLRCFGWPTLEMKKDLTATYGIRSKYFHGAEQRKKAEDLKALFVRIGEYARVSCLVWLLLLATHKKDEVLELLENALLDGDTFIRLKEWCNPIAFATRL